MNTIKKTLLLFAAFLMIVVGNTQAQNSAHDLQQMSLASEYSYVFDKDSLRGFDEPAARKHLLDNHYYGKEIAVMMYAYKREYINNKYHLPSIYAQGNNSTPPNARTAVAGCINEDFEASSPGLITSSSQIAGWSVYSGSVTGGQNNCNITPATSPAVGYSELIDCSAPGGYIDPNIGSAYPIYSIFGSGLPNAAAAAANPQITSGLYGSKVLRLNNYTSDASAWGSTGGTHKSKETLTKTFSVTASNALFRLAFIDVTAPGHDCCGGSGLKINVLPLTCPSFSIYSPSSSCTNGSAQNFQFYAAPSGLPINPSTTSGGQIYTKWTVSAVDLTQYIGQTITIELTAYDCNGGAHYGYMYIDAQCGPMTVTGNGKEFEAGLNLVPNVSTCGTSGATVCAADGMESYAWMGPGLPAGYATLSPTNQCMVTNLSETYTLQVMPPGACGTFTRLVKTVNLPPPTLLGSHVQASCGSTLSVVSLTAGGSLQPGSNYTITWNSSPSPVINMINLSTNSLTGTYSVSTNPSTPPVFVVVTAKDTVGCSTAVNFTINPTVPLPTFTLFNATGINSITCINSSVDYIANSSYTYGTLSYSWTGGNLTGANPGDPHIGTSASITGLTGPAIVTVTVKDDAYTCATSQTFAVGVNQVPPTVGSITPSIQAITCSNPNIQTMTMTATNPTVNISHVVYSPAIGGSVVVSTATTAIYSPIPGEYDYYLVNNLTGCVTHKTFTVSASNDFPTFGISSTATLYPGSVGAPGNYTVGCADHSLTVINIVNPNTSPNPGGGLSFGFIAPGGGTVYTPTSAQQTVTSIPGTWTLIVQDVVTNCKATIPVVIVQNTIAPNISAVVPTQILTCFTPSVVLEAVTTNTAAGYSWSLPGGGNLPDSPTLAVSSTTNLNSTSAGTYVLIIKDNDNGCTSNTVIPMRQNMFAPTPSISVTSKTITCLEPTMQLSNASITKVPAEFGNTNIIQVSLWEGPVPSPTLSSQSSYIASVPGTYTMTIKDLNNGCTSYTTLTLTDGRVYPIVTPQTYLFDCGAETATISAAMSNTVGMSFLWESSTSPLTPTFVAGTATAQVAKVYNNLMGAPSVTYFVHVVNTINGCDTEGPGAILENGSLSGNFTPDATSGFAPMTVNFSNKASSSSPVSGTQSITSVWNYGNGVIDTSYVNTNSSVSNGTVTYSQPGTYTVILYTSKGSCTAMETAVIRVDIPSSVEVPNVFTPNGDGVNDMFFLKVANLSEVQMTIYDRWGRVVYELTSETGNIAWDGTTMYGKDAPAGTYFYILSLKGKDGKTEKDFKTADGKEISKGTINLYR